jgi:hypothetical protein
MQMRSWPDCQPSSLDQPRIGAQVLEVGAAMDSCRIVGTKATVKREAALARSGCAGIRCVVKTIANRRDQLAEESARAVSFARGVWRSPLTFRLRERSSREPPGADWLGGANQKERWDQASCLPAGLQPWRSPPSQYPSVTVVEHHGAAACGVCLAIDLHSDHQITVGFKWTFLVRYSGAFAPSAG